MLGQSRAGLGRTRLTLKLLQKLPVLSCIVTRLCNQAHPPISGDGRHRVFQTSLTAVKYPNIGSTDISTRDSTGETGLVLNKLCVGERYTVRDIHNKWH
jgi:hypothetical protein